MLHEALFNGVHANILPPVDCVPRLPEGEAPVAFCQELDWVQHEILSSLHRGRELESHCGSLAHLRFNQDLSVQALCYLVADVQSQTVASGVHSPSL
jgi:hypothetical protein